MTPELEQVVGEVLGHLLGERGDEHPVAATDPVVDLLDEVVDLALGGLHDDLGVDEAGGAHDLLDHAVGDLELVGAGRGRQEDHLRHLGHELLEAQRPVVGGRRQPEAVLDEGVLAAAVALVLAVQLRDRLVALVEHHAGSRRGRSRAGCAAPRPRRARRSAPSSSRCRCRTRPRPSSRGRTGCACGGAGPRAACPRARRWPAAPAARPRCARWPCACARRWRRSAWRGRRRARRGRRPSRR